jgi:enterochelin esterase-like enzyme
LLLGLEHRFFGKSWPTYDTALANLQYLTIEQALEDTVAFQRVIKHRFNLKKANKWVAFGASYAGALAAWLREKYPDNFFAAYASSATIFEQYNDKEYMEVVNYALNVTSPMCLQNTYAAVNQMKAFSTTNAGRAVLTQLFQ